MKVRIKFSKHGALKYIGHLDIMRFFQKTIRRSGIDIAYSKGFSPHQIMSFAQPLGVGIESEGEYFDIEMNSYPGDEYMVQALNDSSVPEIRILESRVIPDDMKNAMASVACADYRVSFRDGYYPDFDITESISRLLSKDSVMIIKESKKGTREIDIRPGLFELKFSDSIIQMLVDASSSGNIKPIQVIEAIYKEAGQILPPFSIDITRIDTYRVQDEKAPVSRDNIVSL